MDPSVIFSSGKSLVDFAKSLLGFVREESLGKTGSRRLFTLYVALAEYVEAKERYFDCITDQLVKLAQDEVPGSERRDILWKAQFLSEQVARKHYQAYSTANGLAIVVKPFSRPLHDCLKAYNGRVSESMGFSSEEVALRNSFFAIAAGHKLKLKQFSRLYRVSCRNGKLFMGDLAVGEDTRFEEFVQLHRDSKVFYRDFLQELETVIREHFEVNELV